MWCHSQLSHIRSMLPSKWVYEHSSTHRIKLVPTTLWLFALCALSRPSLKIVAQWLSSVCSIWTQIPITAFHFCSWLLLTAASETILKLHTHKHKRTFLLELYAIAIGKYCSDGNQVYTPHALSLSLALSLFRSFASHQMHSFASVGWRGLLFPYFSCFSRPGV